MFLWLKSKILFYGSVALAFLVFIFTFGRVKYRQGVKEAVQDIREQEDKREDKGREAAFKEKRDTDGLSDGDVVDRLRRRTDRWGGL